MLVESGVIAMTAFISPFRTDRQRARGIFPHGDFIEIFCDASLDVCEQRDVKGLYRRARAGEVKEFTGISSPYEARSIRNCRFLRASGRSRTAWTGSSTTCGSATCSAERERRRDRGIVSTYSQTQGAEPG